MNLSSLNITNDDRFPKDNENASIVGYVILLLTSGIPALTNISYIVVCFRIFSKEFNKLLILCLCLSGCISGLSTVWYSVLSIFRSVLLSPLSCSFSIFLVAFGLCLSYSFLFILNLTSYLTVKSFNYGIKQKLNRIKFPLFCGVLIGSFLISCSIWLIPHSHVIKTCSSVSLFGEYYNIFVFVDIGTVAFLLLATIITSILAVKEIYNIFSKQLASNALFLRSNKIDARTDDDDHIETKIGQQKHSEVVFSSSSQKVANEDGDNLQEPGHSIQSFCKINDKKCREQSVSMMFMAGRKMSSDHNVGTVEQTHLAGRQSLTCNIGAVSTKQVKLRWKPWERKALTTNLLITFSTVLLTGPFIGVMLASTLVDNIPYQVVFITFVQFSLNNAISPFIYAWRIPEIRQQLKNICKQN